MARITPSVRATTLDEWPAARPAATKVTALIVDATRAGGADPDAGPADNTAAKHAVKLYNLCGETDIIYRINF